MSVSIEHLSISKLREEERHYLTKQVTFSVKSGKTLAILGCSGSGKTLTALAIAGLLPRQLGYLKGGKVLFENLNLLMTPEWQLQKLRAASIAYLFQEPATAFNPVMSIGQQMDEVLRRHQHDNRKMRYQRCLKGLSEVELNPQCYDFYPHQLSGGMKQRALLALMLLVDLKILIADEITSALDPETEKHILELLKRLQAQRQFTVILITHNQALARYYADDVVVLYQGEVVEKASASEFFEAPQHPYSQQLLHTVLKPKIPKPIEGDPILAVEKLCVDYPIRKGAWRRCVGVTHAVIDAHFALYPGQTLALVGTSGSGKSSIAKALFGLVKSQSDAIVWQGKKVSLPQLLGRMQLILQDPAAALDPRMTIAQILEENFNSKSPVSYKQQIENVMDSVGLDKTMLARYPHEFSGGQRQRICIARALMASSPVWVLDESTSALDSLVKAQILNLLKKLQAELQLAYLFISHDWEAIHCMADEIKVMKAGRLAECIAAA